MNGGVLLDTVYTIHKILVSFVPAAMFFLDIPAYTYTFLIHLPEPMVTVSSWRSPGYSHTPCLGMWLSSTATVAGVDLCPRPIHIRLFSLGALDIDACKIWRGTGPQTSSVLEQVDHFLIW